MSEMINYPSRDQAGLFATGDIRQNIKFEAFWCVFLTHKKREILKAGEKYSLLNSSEKRKFPRTT